MRLHELRIAKGFSSKVEEHTFQTRPRDLEMSVGQADLFGQAEKVGKASVGVGREHKGVLHRHELAQTRKGGQVRSGLFVSRDADLLCKRQLKEQFVERPEREHVSTARAAQ